ncbi:MAG TPA: nicotinate-nucleotide--dimethylbenzimidazole phosphoribosyltransferase, partial [Alphaproteobacteria bacterium]|nr:nicotinate-nucleotide--dimethylbenzimidazole phosphoribosyltransferase [Alphaproteobacteria bacterium]
RKPLIAIFAGNHGIVAHGVSAYPPDVTAEMVSAFAAGGAAINQLARAQGAGLQVFDLALDHPVPDITQHDAFDEQGLAATIAFGMEAISSEPDVLCLGEMGIGNSSVAATLSLCLFGGQASDWVGPGTGLDRHGIERKALIVARAAERVCGDGPRFGLEVLRRAGGREFAAIAGAILAARHQRIPVILDGYAVTAAAACLWAEDRSTLDHCLAGHVSAEPGHRRLLEQVGMRPLLDLSMRLGEGTGAALALGLVKSALAAHAGMANFSQMGVSGGPKERAPEA